MSSSHARTRIMDNSPMQVVRHPPAMSTLAPPPPIAVEPTILAAAGDETHTGAMLALVPSAADRDRLTLDDGEVADELHLTLWYLGDAVDFADPNVEALQNVASRAAQSYAPVITNAFGVGLWNWDGDEPAVVLNISDAEQQLVEIRAAVGGGVANSMLNEWTRIAQSQHSPWVPHVCVAYADDLDTAREALTMTGPITFDTLRLAVAAEVYDYPLRNSDARGD